MPGRHWRPRPAGRDRSYVVPDEATPWALTGSSGSSLTIRVDPSGPWQTDSLLPVSRLWTLTSWKNCCPTTSSACCDSTHCVSRSDHRRPAPEHSKVTDGPSRSEEIHYPVTSTVLAVSVKTAPDPEPVELHPSHSASHSRSSLGPSDVLCTHLLSSR